MDDTKENTVLKCVKPAEEFNEQPEDKEERSCVANECIFTR